MSAIISSGREGDRMSERLCVFCNHLRFGTNQAYASADAEMDCAKNHFTIEPLYADDLFRQTIRTAKTCPDYDEAKGTA